MASTDSEPVGRTMGLFRDAPAPPDMRREARIHTVSSLNRRVRLLIEDGVGIVRVEGEISDLAQPGSGHLYWRLKDASAQLRCAMFRQQNRLLNFRPADGQQVVARGRVSLYEPRGDYQLIVDWLEEAGEGLLRQRFEALKRKLGAEGLFDERRKRKPPELPRRIGVITSRDGAALRDILNVLARRFPAVPVLIYPTSVQAAGAAREIAAALELADRRGECDLLILARGGGSLRDLWPFNEEVVARAVARVRIPVVSGVGHETDFTIADFAADVRAPTPSAAAELAVPDRAERLRLLRIRDERLSRAVRQRLADPVGRLAALGHRLGQSHPGARLRHAHQRLDELEARFGLALRHALQARRSRLGEAAARLRGANPGERIRRMDERLEFAQRGLLLAVRATLRAGQERLSRTRRALESVSPLATLDRGYAIVSVAAGASAARAASAAGAATDPACSAGGAAPAAGAGAAPAGVSGKAPSTALPAGAIITDAGNAPPGTAVDILLFRGELTAIVEAARIPAGGRDTDARASDAPSTGESDADPREAGARKMDMPETDAAEHEPD